MVAYCAPFLVMAQVYDRLSIRAKTIALAAFISADVALWLVLVVWLAII